MRSRYLRLFLFLIMNKEALFEYIQAKRSYLSVGLDSDPDKIPSHLLKHQDPVFEFNKQIIDATNKYCVAYKINTAFYEAQGAKGWDTLEKTCKYIPEDIFTIADAKRGDIGNTSRQYALAFFQHLDFDAITVAPYMGKDSVEPFMGFNNKWVILLALTSNAGSGDFQFITEEGTSRKLYEIVLEKSKEWSNSGQMMYVVGATQASAIKKIRRIVPDHFLLIPGVGAQGGSLQEVSQSGLNDQCGLLVNASRSIIYASNDKGFAQMAAKEAESLQKEMSILLDQYVQ